MSVVIDCSEARLFASAAGLSSVGRYSLIRVIGHGPSGTVLLGYDPEHDREIAIGLMVAHESSPWPRRDLAEEARAWARVHHPNLVHIHDVGTFVDPRNGQAGVFIARELIAGVDLSRWLEVSRDASWTRIASLFVAAGRGLAAAHAAGLVHRSFAAASVIVGVRGEVKIVEFGSHDAGPLGMAPSVLACIQAPEVLAGNAASTAADQYSFCAALWHALSRHHHANAVPRKLTLALTRGLAPNPRDRWPSMDDLLRAIDRCLPGRLRRSLAAVMSN